MSIADNRAKFDQAMTTVANISQTLAMLEGVLRDPEAGAAEGLVRYGEEPLTKARIMRAFGQKQAIDTLSAGLYGKRESDNHLYFNTVGNIHSLREQLDRVTRDIPHGTEQDQRIAANHLYSDAFVAAEFGTREGMYQGMARGRDAYSYAGKLASDTGAADIYLQMADLIPPIEGVNFGAMGQFFESVQQAVMQAGRVISDAVMHPEQYGLKEAQLESGQPRRGSDGRAIRGDTSRSLPPAAGHWGVGK